MIKKLLSLLHYQKYTGLCHFLEKYIYEGLLVLEKATNIS